MMLRWIMKNIGKKHWNKLYDSDPSTTNEYRHKTWLTGEISLAEISTILLRVCWVKKSKKKKKKKSDSLFQIKLLLNICCV